MDNQLNRELDDACARLQRAIDARAENARHVHSIQRKGRTLYVHVNYALEDLRRLDNARY